MNTIQTHIVVSLSGQRDFFDNEEAAFLWARVLGPSLKGVYRAILEVVAYEELSVPPILEVMADEGDETIWKNVQEKIDALPNETTGRKE